MPQTMEEMFKGWQTAQNMLGYMKAVMLLASLSGFRCLPNSSYRVKCGSLAEENEKITREVNRKQGRVNAIDKEFYDKLFAQY